MPPLSLYQPSSLLTLLTRPRYLLRRQIQDRLNRGASRYIDEIQGGFTGTDPG